MAKILVVSNTTYPIPAPSGRHLFPGEIAEIDDTEQARHDIAEGRLFAVPARIVKNEVVPPPDKERKGRPIAAPKPDEGESE